MLEVGKMYKIKAVTMITILLFALPVIPVANAQTPNKGARHKEAFDPVEFLKRFKVGMSYTAVQEALPKNVEQDILSYIVTDEVFVLTIDWPSTPNWSASFKFDTLDAPMRRPEELIEISCGATVSSRSETFDSMVGKVTAVFGDPMRLVRTRDKIQQAGWRVAAGSVLTLEYSIVPSGLSGSDVSVEFIIKRSKRPKTASQRLAA
jgi:hypothetical protein